MLRTVLKVIGAAIVLAVVGLFGILAIAAIKVGRPIAAPYPPIEADASPEALARGRAIFLATCDSCHRAPSSPRSAGHELDDVPAFLGNYYSANLTHDPTAGIGGLRDEEIARAIRYGVNRSGQRTSLMPSFAMGDTDVAAVMGFVRSGDPLFAPDPTPVHAQRMTLAAKAVFWLSGAAGVADLPAIGIPVPARQASVEYGRYMALAVYGCGDCHTAGFSPDKAGGSGGFAGGFELRTPDGAPIVSPNLTFDATGLAGWKLADFQRALRDGLRPDGSGIRLPMPRYRDSDDAELEALYLFLQSLPHRPSAGAARGTAGGGPPAIAAGPAASRAAEPIPADRLFAHYGCARCHGPGRPFHAALAQARGMRVEELARFIRNADEVRPGIAMPTYDSVIPPAAALDLARWLQAPGNSLLPPGGVGAPSVPKE